MRSRRTSLARALAALLLATSVAHAAPPPRPLRDALPAEAKADYLAGRALFADDDAAGALLKFARAYSVAKDPRLLWDEAVCEKSLRHYASVRSLLTRYLAEGGSLLTPADRAEANELALAIAPFTTELAITASEPGALVSIDGESVGTTPLGAPVVVDIGTHAVAVEKEGYRRWTEEIVVGERRTEAVAAKLARAGGTLDVAAPAGARVSIDGVDVGAGRTHVSLFVGGHALRVTAPGFLPYASDVVVRDAMEQHLDVTLVRDTRDPRSAELRVAVGCGDPDPRTRADGIAIDVDDHRVRDGDGIEVVSGYDEIEQRARVDFLRLHVTPGKHVVRVAIPDCVPSETRIVASDDAPALVSGSLARAERELMRGPSGTPDGLRASFGAVLQLTTGSFGGATHGPFTGASGTVGYVSRWFVGLADFGISTGDVNFPTGTVSGSHYVARIRAGLRVPLDIVALSAGSGLGFELLEPVEFPGLVVPIWGAIDLHPLCDWAIPLTTSWTSLGDASVVAFELGLAFQPNHDCRREASTVHGL